MADGRRRDAGCGRGDGARRDRRDRSRDGGRSAARRAPVSAALDRGARPPALPALLIENGPLRVALVHDYLNQRGGAERVFAHIAAAYPDAPVYTSIWSPTLADIVPRARVRTTFLQRFPFHDKGFRALAPLYPAAFEALDLRGFDTIVSSTTAWAKGVVVPPGAVHVCYINTVSRFVFDAERYVGGFRASALARPLIRRLAAWDVRAAQRPTRFVANSRNVAERIARYYGRDADVLPCPVDVGRFTVGRGAGDAFVVVSRLLPYKRVDLAIAACARAGVPLHVVGTGPAEAALRAAAAGTRTTFHGYADDATVNALVGDARAVILPGEEDFGLVPLEAAAAGTPTIALRAGGARETIVEGETGAFFERSDEAALAAVIAAFDRSRFRPERLRAHAEAFAPPRFVARLRAIVDEVRAQSMPTESSATLTRLNAACVSIDAASDPLR
jgi:glycosyltransferase involved in cell wall biosynthesis